MPSMHVSMGIVVSVLQLPYGISVDNDGNVYVVGYYTHNVVVISPDGQRHRQLLSSKDIWCIELILKSLIFIKWIIWITWSRLTSQDEAVILISQSYLFKIKTTLFNAVYCSAFLLLSSCNIKQKSSTALMIYY
jgi:hypothetical protein